MKKIIVSSVLALSLISTFLLPNYTEAASTTTVEQNKVINTGKKFIGTKYRFGGTTPSGFDCSGFVGYTYSKAIGKKLPRSTSELYQTGKAVSKSNLQVGDLVFFTTYKKGASHTGIYVGNNKFIHSSSSKGVTIDSLSNSYWKPKYIGAKRI
ncbi:MULTISPECIES: C40 family peptidase [Bacillus]|uniref:C40 family peptidase n=1 Tax=Bacillus TaxID=1386 RepID=UPI0002E9090F|nr:MULTISPECIES: C40 family peptidase [Bacillus]